VRRAVYATPPSPVYNVSLHVPCVFPSGISQPTETKNSLLYGRHFSLRICKPQYERFYLHLLWKVVETQEAVNSPGATSLQYPTQSHTFCKYFVTNIFRITQMPNEVNAFPRLLMGRKVIWKTHLGRPWINCQSKVKNLLMEIEVNSL